MSTLEDRLEDFRKWKENSYTIEFMTILKQSKIKINKSMIVAIDNQNFYSVIACRGVEKAIENFLKFSKDVENDLMEEIKEENKE